MKYLTTNKWKLAIKVIPFVLVILVCKLLAHKLNVEIFSLSPLFGAIISANVFLISFLISGVLADYKESEKLPGELACSLEALLDECNIVYKNKKAKVAKNMMVHLKNITTTILRWLHKKEKTIAVFDRLTELNNYFLAMEPLTQANFIVRMKQEQNIIRKTITRIHAIRETSFNPAGYAIAEIISTVLCVGLIFTRIDPYYESIFFVTFVSYILIYMVLLIKDLDNPFGYYVEENMADEVSLKPLFDFEEKIKTIK